MVLLVSMGSLVVSFAYKFSKIDTRFTFSTVLFTDAVKSRIEIKTHESENLFTVTIVIIGGLLGLLAAKPDEVLVTLEDRPELLMFMGALVLLFS